MRTLLLLSLISICLIGKSQYVKLYDFAGFPDGESPQGDLLYDGTYLYGTTYSGGITNLGTVFRIKPDGTGFSKMIDCSGTVDGYGPQSSLISDGTFLYGVTSSGGITNAGIIFKIKPDESSYSKLFDFGGALNGKYPIGSLLFDGTYLYGMTQGGGLNSKGVIYKIKPDGTSYSNIFDFAGNSNGANPNAALITDGIFLYGMTVSGGANNYGVIFKIKPDGSNFTKLFDFSSTTGVGPFGTLIYDGNYLYGMASQAGANGKGNIFKIKTDGNGFTVLLDFTGVLNGRRPFGSLFSDGSFLYGMTQWGGANCYSNSGLGCGVIFRIKSDGTQFSKLFDFDGTTDGREPTGTLISDGKFLYGTTHLGGINDKGVVFKIGINTVAVDLPENKTESDISIFPNPFSTQLTIETKNQFHESHLIIYNSIGQIVREVKNISGQSMTVSRYGLTDGIYFLQITEENKPVLSEKIILAN